MDPKISHMSLINNLIFTNPGWMLSLNYDVTNCPKLSKIVEKVYILCNNYK